MLERLGPALDGWWGDLSRMELDEPAREALLAAMAQHPAQPCTAQEMQRLVQQMRQVQAFCSAAGA